MFKEKTGKVLMSNQQGMGSSAWKVNGVEHGEEGACGQETGRKIMDTE